MKKSKRLFLLPIDYGTNCVDAQLYMENISTDFGRYTKKGLEAEKELSKILLDNHQNP